MESWQFTYQGKLLTRFDHLYNSTYLNTRGVELSIAADFLCHHVGNTLELGNVLSHYAPAIGAPPRVIVDKYEQSFGVHNVDVFDIVGEFDVIVSISTIEHIGLDFGEHVDLGASARAVEHLKNLLVPGGCMLITLPIGWHPTLEPEDLGFTTGVYFYWTVDDDWHMSWHETANLRDVPTDKLKYGETTPWAGCVWIGELHL